MTSPSRLCIIRQANQTPNCSNLKSKVFFNLKTPFLRRGAMAFARALVGEQTPGGSGLLRPPPASGSGARRWERECFPRQKAIWTEPNRPLGEPVGEGGLRPGGPRAPEEGRRGLRKLLGERTPAAEPQSQSGSLTGRSGPQTLAVADAGVTDRWATPADVAKVRENHRGARRSQGDETPKSVSTRLWGRCQAAGERAA